MRTSVIPSLVSQSQSALYIWFHAYKAPDDEKPVATPTSISSEIKPKHALNTWLSYGSSHPVLGRLYAVPVALIDTTLDSLMYPLFAIENLAMSLFNLIGSLFNLYQEKYSASLKDAVICLDMSGKMLGASIFSLIFFPVRFIYQVSNHMRNPTEAESFQYYS